MTVNSNLFDTITAGDAIFVPIYGRPFAYGTSVTVSQNQGINLNRMGIEMWGGGGTTLNAPVVTGNTFQQYNSTASYTVGISVVVGTGPIIQNNVLSGGAAAWWGIELGVQNAVVTGNANTGFQYRIVIQGQSGSNISNNSLYPQSNTAILLTNAGNNQNTTISSNYISNPQNFGIGSNPNDYEGSSFTNNTIVRARVALSPMIIVNHSRL